MPKTNWYVITGAASSGKSTLARELEKKGYKVAYESARVLIDEEMAKGKTIDEIRKDEKIFQKKVLERKIQIEKNLPPEELVFLDRGIPDTFAYNKLFNINDDELSEEWINKCSYKKIFLLDRLHYDVDYARVESDDDHQKLQLYLEETYKTLGFPVQKVPVMPIEERTLFILNNL